MGAKRQDIQVIRALAVGAVVLHHAKPGFFPNGYLGVDVFFVISGFLIIPRFIERVIGGGLTSFTANTKILSEFYQKRFLRLGPAFSIFLIANLLLVFFFGDLTTQKSNLWQSIAAIMGIPNFGSYFFSPDYFNPQTSPLTHLWSLGVEEQLYLLIPILCLFLFRSKTVFGLLAITLLSLIAFLLLLEDHSDSAFFSSYFSPTLRIWEFTIGGLASLSSKKPNKTIQKGFLLLLVVVILFPNELFAIKASILVSVLITYLIIILGTGPVPRNLLAQVLVWIGDRSYSIYLYHLPLLYLAKHSPYLTNSDYRGLWVTASLALTVLLSHLSFEFVEKRFQSVGLRSQSLVYAVRIYLSALAISVGFLVWGISSQWNFVQAASASMPIPAESSLSCDPRSCSPIKNSSILLLGDSHANLFSKELEGLVAMNYGHSLLNMSKLGCELVFPDILNKHRHTANMDFKECLKHNVDSYKFLVQSNIPIVISQRSTVYLPEGLQMDPGAYRKVYFESLNRMLQLPNKVLIIGPVPDYPKSISYFNSPIGIFQDLKNFPLSVSRISLKTSARDDISLRKMVEVTHKHYFSSFSVFCNLKECRRYGPEGWFYIDESHLSFVGVKKIVNRLAIDSDFVSMMK